MTREIQRVVVLGGSGTLGQKLVPVLVSKGFDVTVITRETSKSTTTAQEAQNNVSFKSSDYTLESLTNVFKGQDAVVSTIATEDVAVQKVIVDAAVAAGVKRILPTQFGGDTSRDDLAEVAPFLQPKKDVVDYIKSLDSSSLSWTALCTSGWYDWMLKQGDGLVGWDIKTRSGTIYGSGDQRLLTTHFSQVPEAIAAVLAHVEETKNEFVYVSTLELTQNKVWEALERATGQKFNIDRSDTATLHARAMEHMKRGDLGKAYYDLITWTAYNGGNVGYFPEKSEKWNKILGISQEETLDEMVARVVAEVDSGSHGSA